MNPSEIIKRLKQNQVVAYPTEAVFGLGCNPFSQSAVEKLLVLKQRSREKGLILIAPDVTLLHPFIAIERLQAEHRQRLEGVYDRPTTWVVPARTDTPRFLTGAFRSIAVRLCRHPAVRQLCTGTGFALTSTSANLSGLPPCRTPQDVFNQFGADFPVLEMTVGNAANPSEIRDIFTCRILRQG